MLHLFPSSNPKASWTWPNKPQRLPSSPGTGQDCVWKSCKHTSCGHMSHRRRLVSGHQPLAGTGLGLGMGSDTGFPRAFSLDTSFGTFEIYDHWISLFIWLPGQATEIDQVVGLWDCHLSQHPAARAKCKRTGCGGPKSKLLRDPSAARGIPFILGETAGLGWLRDTWCLQGRATRG